MHGSVFVFVRWRAAVLVRVTFRMGVCTAALILELLTGGKFCCRYFGADCCTVACFLLFAAGRWILLKWILI